MLCSRGCITQVKPGPTSILPVCAFDSRRLPGTSTRLGVASSFMQLGDLTQPILRRPVLRKPTSSGTEMLI
jgi:hypothetical protein